MPVIIVKARRGVLRDKAAKAECIAAMAEAFARAAGDPACARRATVLIEEVEDEDWGRGGRQVEP